MDFAPLHTYAWQAEGGQVGPGLPNNPALDARIRYAIDNTMQAKGWRAVPEKDADLLLTYKASAEKKVNSTLENYQAAALMDVTYILGTLDLRMMRPSSLSTQTLAVAWEGSVHANIDSTKTLQERDAKLLEAVQALLKKFPSK